ncbi:MAG: hypothetical protein Greene071436_353 [Parcubacteria group bacterium Greene0714_36]|nr:MAG: hypothetical protein Greene071436_353 [Parcubacteria group bacterium Greene0714_36]
MSQEEISDAQAMNAIEVLIAKGEVLIRRSPLGDGGVQCIWEAHRTERQGSIASSVRHAIYETAQKVQEAQEETEIH